MSDLDKIKLLRQSSGAGFKDCGIAIEEADGDLDKAAEILRVKDGLEYKNAMEEEVQ